MTGPAEPRAIDFRFTAALEKEGGPFATFVTVPGSVEYLGTAKAVKVTGTVDGIRSPRR